MLYLNQISTYIYNVYGEFETGKTLDIRVVVSKTGRLLKSKGITYYSPEHEEFLNFLRENNLICF